MSYSIDWPDGFKSRTSNPSDRCFIGRAVDIKPKPVPAPAPKPAAAKVWRFRRDTKAWAMWCLLVRRAAPLTASQIAEHLGWQSIEVSGIAKRPVKAGAIDAKRTSSGVEYSLGKTPAVELDRSAGM